MKIHKKYFLYALLVCLLMVCSPVSASADWKTVDGKTYYYKNGKKLTGFQKIGKYTYYFNKDGVRQTKWLSLKQGDTVYRYYFSKKYGRMFIGKKKIGKKYYLFAQDGKMLTGKQTVQSTGKTYYAKKNGVLAQNEWVNSLYYYQDDCTLAVNTWVNGKYVDANGRFTGQTNYNGLMKDGSKTYYYVNNVKQTGFQTVNGKLYYFDPSADGVMRNKAGWFTVGNYRYYTKSTGVVSTNTWVKRRYVNASGAMLTGWQTVEGKRYYFKTNGIRAHGWLAIGDDTYYFVKGVLQTSQWVKSTYYVGADGKRASGLTQIGKNLYYFDKKTAVKKTGLIKEGTLRYYAKATGVLYRNTFFKGPKYSYYASSDGHLLQGLQTIKGNIYYFNKKTARMAMSKKVTVDGATYYFKSNGKAVKSAWRKISGKYYYFDANGKMAVSTIADGYQVSASGERLAKVDTYSGWKTVDGSKYYYTSGKMATGWTTISGSTYYFSETGVMATGIQSIDNKKYYFYPTGILAVNVTLAVGSKQYTINTSGVVTAETNISVTGTSKGAQIAKYALNFVGNKYVYGGTSLTNGADCSGFVMSVFANYNIKLLRVADDQRKGPGSSLIASGYQKAVKVSSGSILPGDLVFYGSSNYASHVGIYIGNGKIVHASNSQPYPAGGIKISAWNYATPIAIVRYWS